MGVNPKAGQMWKVWKFHFLEFFSTIPQYILITLNWVFNLSSWRWTVQWSVDTSAATCSPRLRYVGPLNGVVVQVLGILYLITQLKSKAWKVRQLISIAMEGSHGKNSLDFTDRWVFHEADGDGGLVRAVGCGLTFVNYNWFSSSGSKQKRCRLAGLRLGWFFM